MSYATSGKSLLIAGLRRKNENYDSMATKYPVNSSEVVIKIILEANAVPICLYYIDLRAQHVQEEDGDLREETPVRFVHVKQIIPHGFGPLLLAYM